MRTFCALSLVVLSGLGLAPSARAQTSYYTSPTPPARPASYNFSAAAASFGSSFSQPEMPAPAQQGMIVPQAAPDSAPPGMTFSESLNCWDEHYGESVFSYGECTSGRWFGSIGVIVMGRNRPNSILTTIETGNPGNQIMATGDAGANWAPGGEITVGFNFGPGGSSSPGVAFTYWGISTMEGAANVSSSTDNLSVPWDLTGVTIGGRAASDFFVNSAAQRLRRSDRADNFELNLLQGMSFNGGRLYVVGLAGFRYFRFDERLTLGAAAAGTDFGDNGGADEAFDSYRTINNLYGGQFGATFNFVLNDSFQMYVTPKAGLYGNQMITRGNMYAGNGDQGPSFSAYKSDVSFLGEIETGFSYMFRPGWRAYFGYRVVGISGVSLADNSFLLNIPNGGFSVNQNGSLLLHGAFAGVAWTF